MADSRNQRSARLKSVAKTEPAAVRSLPPGLQKWALTLVGTAVFIGAVWFFWDNEFRSAYPVRYVRIEGAIYHLDEREFTQAVAPLMRSGLLGVDLDAVASVAKSFPWVERVRVVRQWPDTVTLQVREHRPVARWNEDSLLSDRGMRFAPSSVERFTALPRLYGETGQENMVLDVWRKLNELLRERQWRVTMLSCNFRQSWSARLSDGKELILGREDPVAKVARLLTLLPELGYRQTAAIKKVDLRYRNGFAVVWRFEPPIEPTPAEPEDPKPEVFRRVPGALDPSPQLAANRW